MPGSVDANGGESLDFKVMIHKIHAGGELASLAGPDGIVWDNPATTADESADNGQYAIWGNRNTKHEWWKAEFPAVIENCQKCHQGTGANVDNWKTNPTREACGSCHDTVNFATGANHAGGPARDRPELRRSATARPACAPVAHGARLDHEGPAEHPRVPGRAHRLDPRERHATSWPARRRSSRSC